jgi:hypothetical protein
MLTQAQGCNPRDCNICQTTKWSKWSVCDCKKGRMATQTTRREDIGPNPGMIHCMIPTLSRVRPCYHEVCLARKTTAAPTPKATVSKAAAVAAAVAAAGGAAEPTSAIPAVAHPTALVLQTVKLMGMTLPKFRTPQQRRFVGAYADVVSVNNKDVVVQSIVGDDGGDDLGHRWITVKLKINQVRREEEEEEEEEEEGALRASPRGRPCSRLRLRRVVMLGLSHHCAFAPSPMPGLATPCLAVPRCCHRPPRPTPMRWSSS